MKKPRYHVLALPAPILYTPCQQPDRMGKGMKANVTQAMIAEMTGVSRGTVSLVLGGRARQVRINPQRAEAILACARTLNYRANGAALAIKRKCSYGVGVITLDRPGIQECVVPNYLSILGINDGLQDAGYVLSLVRHADISDPSKVSRVFKEQMLDGVIVLNSFPGDDVGTLKGLFPRCVWVDTVVWEATGCIRRDEIGAGRLAAAALIRAGYRHLLYLGVDPSDVPKSQGGAHYSVGQRRQGVQAAAKATRGVHLEDCDTSLQEYGDYARAEPQVLQAMKAGWGIVAYDVPRARCVGQTAASNRLVPGIDFGLACAESSSESDRVWPQLTCVGFDRREMGRRAARMMRQWLEQERPEVKSELLKGSLNQGETGHRRA
jgi:DNA-binding LacI/PurR family transcriptional regulator